MALARLWRRKSLRQASSGSLWFSVVFFAGWAGVIWWNVLGDAWIAARWPRADAIIQGDPATWPPQRPPGGPLGDELRVQLPDGRVVEGRSVKPLREYSGAPLYETRRMQPGDRVSVHVRPSDPPALAARQELKVFAWPFWAFGVVGSVYLVLTVREILRRRRHPA